MDVSGTFWIIFGLGAGVFGFFLYFFNKFTRTRVRMRETLTNVDLFLRRQNELLKQLEELLMRFEVRPISHLQAALEAGKTALATDPVPGKAAGLDRVDEHYGGLIREARSLNQLQRQPDFDRIIEGLERNALELQAARRYYNALVREHNIMVETFPSALVSILLRFPKAEFLSDPVQLSAS